MPMLIEKIQKSGLSVEALKCPDRCDYGRSLMEMCAVMCPFPSSLRKWNQT